MKFYSNAFKSPDVVLVLVWISEDFAKREREKMLLSARTTRSSMEWRMPLGLCPGSSLHWGLWEQGLLEHSWGQLRDLCQALGTPALRQLCPWQPPLLGSFPSACPGWYGHHLFAFPGHDLVLCSSRVSKGMHQPCFSWSSHKWVWWLCWPGHWWEEISFSLYPPG